MGGAPASIQLSVPGEIKQSIDVPKSVVGKLIGKGGDTITLIQRKSGAKVTIDQNVPEGMPCKVMMSGTSQSLVFATQLVQELMMGIPSSKIGANIPPPMAPMAMGMGMAMNPYGGYPQQPQYGMQPYQQMQMPMQQPQQQYGMPYGYPQQQQQQQQQYAMTAANGNGAVGGYPYGAPTSVPAYNSYGGNQITAVAPVQKPVVNSSVWTEHKTDDGITYWYNASTGVSQVFPFQLKKKKS
jgi:far upstream element-binding protein